jgi:hypothetical protein
MSSAEILGDLSRVFRRMVRFYRLFVLAAELGIIAAVGTI